MLPHFEEFLEDLRKNGHAEDTIYQYRRDMTHIAAYLLGKGITFDQVDRRLITAFKKNLASKQRIVPPNTKGTHAPLSENSINRILSMLRGYLKFLQDHDYPIPISPGAVKGFKLELKQGEITAATDIIRLIEAPTEFETDGRVAYRNRAILEVIYATGMKISEIVALDRNHVDESGRIFVPGVEHFVFLTERAMEHLQRYMLTRSDRKPELFVPYRGGRNKQTNRRISANYVADMIQRYRVRLGIKTIINARSIRARYAKSLATQGVDPVIIQNVLGYRSVEAIRILIG